MRRKMVESAKRSYFIAVILSAAGLIILVGSVYLRASLPIESAGFLLIAAGVVMILANMWRFSTGKMSGYDMIEKKVESDFKSLRNLIRK